MDACDRTSDFCDRKLAIYWAMWPTTVQVIFAILLGLPLYMYYDHKMVRSHGNASSKVVVGSWRIWSSCR